ncbi:DUF6615 family protein [Mesorhizobium sp. 128a]
MTATMCELAKKLPQLVGNLLDRESKLKRGRFREETLTDIFTGALAAFAGPELVIEYPPEATTGGDIDLDFNHISSGTVLLVRLQAKRLNAHRNSGKAVAIRHRAYNELLHTVPKNSRNFQYKTLAAMSGPRLPLYMFYNHGTVTRDPYFSTPGPAVRGINLAFAKDIVSEMDVKLAAVPKRLHHKRLSHLRPHLFGLEALLCPSGTLHGTVPTPDAVVGRLDDVWRSGPFNKRGDDDDGVRRYLFSPVEKSVGDHPYRRVPDGLAIRVNDALERPTITFMSGRTEDGRTPKIASDVDSSG